ncbi:MAG TPA: SDR family NAD(P)-dependent oxidoreductase [Puia sp.]|jgi:NAD(P)-dependent dehydrogenase (short-subunit alcohol dehydrogenase family)|nr:SDR family NAD(P)-dependent oxidoreductase [Puia sp.]
MKTIFITGASTAAGHATARLFAGKGWKVIATLRQPESATELAALPNTTLLPLDITDPEQISKTVATVIAMVEIDLVFNNAGYGLIGSLEATSDEQILRQINTNLLGMIRIIKAFIPHFRSRGHGLFISTSSIGRLVSFPLNSIYHATQWALEGWSESMAFKLKRLGIGIKTVAPGGIATDSTGRSPGQARSEAYDGRMSKVWNAFAGAFTFSTPEQIAAVVYEAATDGKDRLHYAAGEHMAEKKEPGIAGLRSIKFSHVSS